MYVSFCIGDARGQNICLIGPSQDCAISLCVGRRSGVAIQRESEWYCTIARLAVCFLSQRSASLGVSRQKSIQFEEPSDKDGIFFEGSNVGRFSEVEESEFEDTELQSALLSESRVTNVKSDGSLSSWTQASGQLQLWKNSARNGVEIVGSLLHTFCH